MGKQYKVRYADTGEEATLSQEEWDKRSRTSGVRGVTSVEVVDDTPKQKHQEAFPNV